MSFTIGIIFRYRNFLSTSKSTVWFHGRPVRYQITSKTGKNIAEISMPGEEEVLFKTGTKFKVTNFVGDDGQKFVVIHLEEVI